MSFNQNSTFGFGGGAGGGSGPGGLSDANNGLSVSGGAIAVLGQDIGEVGNPGQLLSDREIPLNAFNLHIGVMDTAIWIEEVNQEIYIGDPFGVGSGALLELRTGSGRLQYYDNNGTYLDIDPFSSRYRFGDFDIANNGTQLDIDDANILVALGDVASQYSNFQLLIDIINEDIFLGDPNFIGPVVEITGFGGGSNPLFEAYVPSNADADSYIDLSMFHNGDVVFLLDMQGLSNRYQLNWRLDTNTGDFFSIERRDGGVFRNLFIDFTNDLYEFGDINAQTNGTHLAIDDADMRFTMIATTSFLNMLDLNGSTRLYRMGEFDNGSDFAFVMDADNQVSQIKLGNNYLDINVPALRYQFGDVDQVNNNSRIDINGSPGSAVIALVIAGNPMFEGFENGVRAEMGDVGNVVNGTKVRVSVNGGIDTVYQNQTRGFLLDMISSIHQFGISNIGNQPILTSNGSSLRMYTEQFDQLIGTSGTAYANGAAAQLGTLTNAPAAGNPTKWLKINDNGTIRHIPAW